MKHKNKITTSILTAIVLAGCGAESSINVVEEPLPPITGQFVDAPVAGLSYSINRQASGVTEPITGTTDANGNFEYFRGDAITFSIGEIEFPVTAGANFVTPLQVFGTDTVFNQRVINTVRLLQTLDSDGDVSNGISISPEASAAATMTLGADETADDFFNRSDEDFATELETWLPNAGTVNTSVISKNQAIENFVNYINDTLNITQPNAFDPTDFSGVVTRAFVSGETIGSEAFRFTPTDEDTALSGVYSQLEPTDGETIIASGTYEFVFGNRLLVLTQTVEGGDDIITRIAGRSYNAETEVYGLCITDGSGSLDEDAKLCDDDESPENNSFVTSSEGLAAELLRLAELPAVETRELVEEFAPPEGTFYNSTYKKIRGSDDIGLYFKTGGTPVIANGEIAINAARFSIGNNEPAKITTSSDTVESIDSGHQFNLSKGFTISFDVVSHAGGDAGAGSLSLYADNNTSGEGNSVHGASSKFLSLSINNTNFPVGQTFSYTYDPAAVAEAKLLDPEVRQLNEFIQNSFIQIRTDSAGVITIDNLVIDTVAGFGVANDTANAPTLEPEPEPEPQPEIIPNVFLPFSADYTLTDTSALFTAEYLATSGQASTDTTAIAMYHELGGNNVVTDAGIQIGDSRFSIGNTTPDVDTADTDTAGTGVFDLSRPYNIVLDIISLGGDNPEKSFQVYVDNNTSSSSKSIHGGDSRIYKAAINDMTVGTLTIPGNGIGTKNSFIQIRAESGTEVVFNNLHIEYINQDLLLEEDFDNATAETFFTSDYKALPNNADLPFYFATGGKSNIVFDNGQITLPGARLTVGQTEQKTNSTATTDTGSQGQLDLSKPYKVLVDIISIEGSTDTTKDFILYVDNNSSSSGNSIHEKTSKFSSTPVEDLVVGQTNEFLGEIGTANSFLQIRTEGGAVVTFDNLRIEYQDLSVCGLATDLYFCDDFTNGDLSNWTVLSSTQNSTAAGDFDVLTLEDGNNVMRYTAGETGGELILATDEAMANVPDSGNYFVEAKIRPRQNSKTSNKQLYLMARYDSVGNWFGGGLNLQNSSSSTKVEVATSINGSLDKSVAIVTPLLLGEKGATDDGVWYTTRFEMIDDVLTVYLNGEKMGSATDATYTAKGLIGIFTNNRSFELDDLMVGDPAIKPIQLTLDYKVPTWETTTSSDNLVINVAAFQDDGITADTFTVESSNPSVVSVSTDGAVVTLAQQSPGSATITLVSGSDTSIVRTIEVTVENGFVMPTTDYTSIAGLVTPDVASTDQYVDTSLSITFDNAITLGSLGEVHIYKASDDSLVDLLKVGTNVDELFAADKSRSLNYTPLSIADDGRTLKIDPRNGVLAYGEEYYVVIGDDVVTGAQLNGVDFDGLGKNTNWSFTTKSTLPASADLLVDDDGIADFRTVQGALTYVMNNVAKDDAATISIKDGLYEEMLYLRNQNNITIQGESRENTIVQYDNYESFNGGSSGRPVFLVESADMLVLNNFTLKNSHIRVSTASNQAEAIYFNSSYRLVANNMNFISEQDTLQLKGYAWFYNSLVAGNVDFIWGYPSAALFENSEIRTIGDSKNGKTDVPQSGGYVLQARVPVETDPGFVFLNSEFTHGEGPLGNTVAEGSTYIARSGGDTSVFDNVTLINNKFDTHIATSGWAVQGVNSQPAPTPSVSTAMSGWREFGSMDMNGNPLDISGRVGGYELTTSEADAFINRAVIFAGFGSSGWDPQPLTTPSLPDEPAQAAPATVEYGFAGNNFNVTGGANGTTLTVDNGADLKAALASASGISSPITIYVDGTITVANNGNSPVIDIKDMDNVSIIGVADRGELDGVGISIRRAKNIIIQNLKIHHVLAPTDAISVEGDVNRATENIWIDHNELYSENDGDESKKDTYDGLIDTKRGAKNITISYNYLHDHWKASLHGHTEDAETDNTDRLITFHHNRFENIESRLPLFRKGYGHLYNNYFNNIHSTAINSRIGAELVVENNYFDTVQNPIVSFYSDIIGYWNISGNYYSDNVVWTTPDTGDVSAENGASTSSYTVPYSYTLDDAQAVKAKVMSNAGIGKIDQSDLVIP